MRDLSTYPDLMTTAEVHEATGVKLRTIQAMCRSGELPTRGGRVYLVPKSVLPEFFTPELAGGPVSAPMDTVTH